jgi:hypothetical protein
VTSADGGEDDIEERSHVWRGGPSCRLAAGVAGELPGRVAEARGIRTRVDLPLRLSLRRMRLSALLGHALVEGGRRRSKVVESSRKRVRLSGPCGS